MIGNLLARFGTTPLLYLLGILVLANLGQAGALAWQGHSHAAALAQRDATASDLRAQLHDVQADKRVLTDHLTAATSANASNLAVIGDLQHRLDAAVGQQQATEAANRTAVAQRDAAYRARDAARAALETQRSTTYATDPACATAAARAVCGAVSGQLFDHWQSAAQPPAAAGGADPAGRGPPPAAGAAGSAPAGGPRAGPSPRSGGPARP